ncbi:MAG: deoxyribodipyrimidine photo-lyase [Abyssibacter sp.]|uniref:cryptochrome/photolyase family protein n=1 Tax=Abyssibacter sp. TaxID=2320200 RepID=UPI00321AC7E9
MTTRIVWLRRDFRLDDNPALLRAAESAERLVVLYIHAPEEDAPWPAGAASCWWLHHSLLALSQQLEAEGNRLVIRSGPSLNALRECIETTGAASVYWNRLYTPMARDRDRRIKTALRDQGIEARSFNAALLAEPWAVETRSGGPYRVFTPFWKSIRDGLRAAAPCPRPMLPPCPAMESEPLDALGLLPDRDWADGFAAHWTPGSGGAQQRLSDFLDTALQDYDSGRNRPDLDATSGLSPHLHFGEIGPRQIVAAVDAASSDDGRTRSAQQADKFLSEIAWREFAHHVLFHFPETLEQSMNPRFRHFEWAGRDSDLQAWQHGQTGIPIVDAGMRQLWHTGWMHNRVRMIVGSLLTKNLRQHWRKGAQWFWDTLVDADLANNTLGWQWIAGCGADAAPYFRIFNPVSQGEKFDPHGAYVRRWVPEIEGLPDAHLHAPWTAPAPVLRQAKLRLGRDYPAPIVDLKASRQDALDAYAKVKG